LATLLWNQNRENHLQGMLAVGCMIRNRVTSGWGQWQFVLDNHEQWSAVPTNNRLKLGDISDVLFLRLLGTCDNLIAGLEKDITAGALWGGCRLDEITSEKFLADIVRNPENHPRISQVGTLVFFK
jgi:hypothetical protein